MRTAPLTSNDGSLPLSRLRPLGQLAVMLAFVFLIVLVITLAAYLLPHHLTGAATLP